MSEGVRPNKDDEQITLSRDLGLLDITMIGIAGMIGAGIFVLTGTAAGVAGPGLLLAFLLNGLITSLTAMVYAELGSTFPGAGGSYLWVKKGTGQRLGFQSGWMSWFASMVAGSLYSLGFGTYAGSLLTSAGITIPGLSERQLALVLAVSAVVCFTYINYRGVSESGRMGNIITGSKIAILLIFALFGILALRGRPGWTAHFQPFLPNGINGVLLAMGFTFIAFEGYEIIAQSGEEVKDPKRNIPIAVFLSIGVVLAIYLLIGFVALAVVDTGDPAVKSWQFLGKHAEVALISTAEQFMPGGSVLLVIGGLVSTLSALNAVTYSSSRVSFAMGRDRNLPDFFADIHPLRHTPYRAVLASGLLMIVMDLALPIEDVASAADIMFLLLFLLVNISSLRLRRKMSKVDRGFVMPWFPFVPIVAIVLQFFLAIYMFKFSPRAWYTAAGWMAVGAVLYETVFRKRQAMEAVPEVLHEEVLLSKEWSCLISLENEWESRLLGHLAAQLASQHDGEVLALYPIRVPPQLTLHDGRYFLEEGRKTLEVAIAQAKHLNVPVHTVIRLGRDTEEIIRKTARENTSNLLLLGWPGPQGKGVHTFNPLIDALLQHPPCNVAIFRCHEYDDIRRILVASVGGPNARLAVQLAKDLARAQPHPVEITVLYVCRQGESPADRQEAQRLLRATVDANDPEVNLRIVDAPSVVEGIIEQARKTDFLFLGAKEETFWQRLVAGNIPETVAHRCTKPTIIVKRHPGTVRSLLRKTIDDARNLAMTGESSPGGEESNR